MARSIPYFRVVVVALGSAGLLAFLLNLTLRDWVAALHLAIVLTFTFITRARSACSGGGRHRMDTPQG
jgi:hypothetical protein